MIDEAIALGILRETLLAQRERHRRETLDRLARLERNIADAAHATITKSLRGGAWSASTSYSPGGRVTHGGIAWRAVAFSAGIEPGSETGALRGWERAP